MCRNKILFALVHVYNGQNPYLSPQDDYSKMSVFKNLKSLFIVEEDKGSAHPDKKEASADSKKSEEQRNQKATVESNSSKMAMDIGDGTRDEKIINTLFKALEKSNLTGFDYMEFKQSIKGLEKMVTDEATRFKSAFSTASTMGLTLDKLVETADYYIKVLDQERSQFVQAANEQTTALVENRKKEMQLLLKSMGDKKATIEKLTKELTASETKLKTIQDGIDNASLKINKTKKNFDVSFNYLKGQISTDIEKMKNYLK